MNKNTAVNRAMEVREMQESMGKPKQEPKPDVIHHSSGLTMFKQGGGWAVGYRPTRQTFCIGSLTEGLADIGNDEEVRTFRFKDDGMPVETFDKKPDHELLPNEIRGIMGKTWIVANKPKHT